MPCPLFWLINTKDLTANKLGIVDGSIWFYAPNKVAPVVFAVAFAASGAYHTWQCM